MAVVGFDGLSSADLVPGTVYEGGTAGSSADEPISKLCHVGNFGGFRPRGAWSVPGAILVVLYTTEDEHDWPDLFDPGNSRFTYFGDNREPGTSVEAALEGKQGNALLAQTFAALRAGRFEVIPPFMVFRKVGTKGRDVEFLGLAAPGAPGVGEDEELVAVWKTKAEGRFLNYRAVFSMLDAPVVARRWIDEIRDTKTFRGPAAPEVWKAFNERGEYRLASKG